MYIKYSSIICSFLIYLLSASREPPMMSTLRESDIKRIDEGPRPSRSGRSAHFEAISDEGLHYDKSELIIDFFDFDFDNPLIVEFY